MAARVSSTPGFSPMYPLPLRHSSDHYVCVWTVAPFGAAYAAWDEFNRYIPWRSLRADFYRNCLAQPRGFARSDSRGRYEAGRIVKQEFWRPNSADDVFYFCLLRDHQLLRFVQIHLPLVHNVKIRPGTPMALRIHFHGVDSDTWRSDLRFSTGHHRLINPLWNLRGLRLSKRRGLSYHDGFRHCVRGPDGHVPYPV